MEKIIYALDETTALAAYYFGCGKRNAPLIVEIHGGGFVYGSALDDKKMCEAIAEHGYDVLSLEYRYAPEVSHPMALNDCLFLIDQATKDTSLGFDRKRMGILGHSAGGNLAAAVCFSLRENNPFRAMALDYPWLNVADNKRKYILPGMKKKTMDKFTKAYYLDEEKRTEALASPLSATDEMLRLLPSTSILTCGRDSLRIDGIRLNERMSSLGLDVTFREYRKAIHGFIEFSFSEQKGLLSHNFYMRRQSRLGKEALEYIVSFFDQKLSA